MEFQLNCAQDTCPRFRCHGILKKLFAQEISQLKEEITDISTEIDAMDTEEGWEYFVYGIWWSDLFCRAKQKNLAMGKKKFNMESKKGVQFLISHNLVAETPEEVAQFLYKEEGLNKTAIGDYLGEKNDFNEAVLKAFVELHDFTDLILVQALRQFLWSFRLPGEAQKIDRMMETFAQRYCQLNPDIFTNSDTCYVLSFAIIMLNTSLHNPSVKDKPSVEQFITMNRWNIFNPGKVYLHFKCQGDKWRRESSEGAAGLPLRLDQDGAVQDPGGRRQRLDAHLL